MQIRECFVVSRKDDGWVLSTHEPLISASLHLYNHTLFYVANFWISLPAISCLHSAVASYAVSFFHKREDCQDTHTHMYALVCVCLYICIRALNLSLSYVLFLCWLIFNLDALFPRLFDHSFEGLVVYIVDELWTEKFIRALPWFCLYIEVEDSSGLSFVSQWCADYWNLTEKFNLFIYFFFRIGRELIKFGYKIVVSETLVWKISKRKTKGKDSLEKLVFPFF